jgi:hypothetical protein
MRLAGTLAGRSGSIRLALALALAATAAVALMSAPPALADSSQSANWAGYAIHHSGVSFNQVVGEWVQPRATCTAGQPAYSSNWVGIGGYSTSSPALEQVGTELDCTGSGAAVSSAWYELVPAASQTTKLIIHPGDRVRASVRITGSTVRLSIDDLTRHRSFTRTVHASVIDNTSAEWIVEAPSMCSSTNYCQTLPLANFGSAVFDSASARTTTRHMGTITDPRWTTTKISLSETGHRFIGGGGPGAVGPQAVPSTLSAKGSAFSVTYGGSSTTTTTASAARVTAGRLVRPRRLP